MRARFVFACFTAVVPASMVRGTDHSADSRRWVRTAGVAEAANVRNYGAVGNGIIDDSAAIQAALHSSYARIYVPPGNYALTSTLRISSNKRLTLSPDAVMLRRAGTSAMLINDADGRTAGYAASTNIIVEGGVWDGNADQHPAACTILAFGHVSDMIIGDCTIRNTPVWHAIELNATRRATIERVHFDGCPNEALQFDTMNSGSPSVFPWFGPYNDAICSDVVVQDCVFENVVTAIGSHSAPAVDGLSIRRCVVNGASGIAIKPLGYKNWRVESCEFIECHTVFTGSGSGFVLRANRISNSRVADINLANCTNGSVENNIIANARSGIVGASPSIVVRDNRLEAAVVRVAPELVPAKALDSFIYATNGEGSNLDRPAEFTAVTLVSVSDSRTSLVISDGQRLELSIAASGSWPLQYQWFKDGVAIPGATARTHVLAPVNLSNTGDHWVVAANSAGSITTAPVGISITNGSSAPIAAVSIINVSIRSQLSAATDVLTAGFGVAGGGVKRLLVRAVGPTLAEFGVTPAVARARLELFDSRGTRIAENSAWPAALAPVFRSVGAFALPAGSGDAALIAEAPAGPGTAQVRGDGFGTALLEIYDASDSTQARVVNFSARGKVGPGEAVLIAGFSSTGKGLKRLLIRGVGPQLLDFGVTGALPDPRLELMTAAGVLIAANDNWNPSLAPTFSDSGAFDFMAGSKDAALLATISGGESYTIVLRGAEGTSGEALVEIYEVP